MEFPPKRDFPSTSLIVYKHHFLPITNMYGKIFEFGLVNKFLSLTFKKCFYLRR